MPFAAASVSVRNCRKRHIRRERELRRHLLAEIDRHPGIAAGYGFVRPERAAGSLIAIATRSFQSARFRPSPRRHAQAWHHGHHGENSQNEAGDARQRLTEIGFLHAGLRPVVGDRFNLATWN